MSAEGPSDSAGNVPLQGQPPVERPVRNPTGGLEVPTEPDAARHDGYGSGTELTDNENSHSETDDDGPFEVYVSKSSKRRKRECSGSSAATILPAYGLVVVFVPIDPNVKIRSFNAIKLTAALEANCPEGVVNIRPNYRLNLFAVDARSSETTSTLLKITKLLGVNVRAYEPRMSNMAVGVIHGVTLDITEEHLLGALDASSPVVRVRRLGKTESVAVTFASATLPDDVKVGYVRYKIYLYVEKPTQCSSCGRLGHVAAACRSPSSCVRCGKKHDTEECPAAAPHCANCGKGHISTSHRCPRWKEEKSVAGYRRMHHVDYATAKTAVQDITAKTGASVISPTVVKERRTRHGLRKSSHRADAIHTDAMDSFPALPTMTETSPPVIASQQAPAKKSLDKRRSAPQVPTTEDFNGASLPHPSHPGLGGILCSAVGALRGLLAHSSSPISSAILLLIDAFYPFLQRLLS